MMTSKRKEELCSRILSGSRQLFLSARISEICMEKGTQKQLESVEGLLQEGFPVYKTFEGYAYHAVKFRPALSRQELKSLEFVTGSKNLLRYGPVGIGKTHMAIASGVKACMLGYKTKFYTVTELVMATFKKAYASNNAAYGLMFHSDRGSQYTASAFRQLLDSINVVQDLCCP